MRFFSSYGKTTMMSEGREQERNLSAFLSMQTCPLSAVGIPPSLLYLLGLRSVFGMCDVIVLVRNFIFFNFVDLLNSGAHC